VTYHKLGEALPQTEILARLEWYRRAYEALVQVAAREPTHRLAGEFLFEVGSNRARELDQLGRFPDAFAQWDSLLVSAQGYQGSLKAYRALSLVHAKRWPEALGEARNLAALSAPDAGRNYETARVFAACSSAANQDSGLSPERRASLARECAAAAVLELGKARKSNYFTNPKNIERLQADTELAPLHSLPEYQKLLHDLAAKPKP
jgi:hypothetical protein